ncbi:MAG: ATP:cob(I)alamin adenosyltransferase [Bifidobacteriaceae bacterium]|jgi:cob(I)alamin adenosyltransferase|nr:ATP:cob(I)alamin adenosyltransferase [Bifidobacteriaceae bacterium]
MVHLTRIYTRLGDAGTTRLADGAAVAKTDPRIRAEGAINEACAHLGLAHELAGAALARGDETPGLDDVARILGRLLPEFFDVGGDFATPLGGGDGPAGRALARRRIGREWVDRLEADCDGLNSRLLPLDSFLLPGGGILAAELHVATAVIRRAERTVWAVADRDGLARAGGVNPWVPRYLNRASDLGFLLARTATAPGKEVLWRAEPPAA